MGPTKRDPKSPAGTAAVAHGTTQTAGGGRPCILSSVSNPHGGKLIDYELPMGMGRIAWGVYYFDRNTGQRNEFPASRLRNGADRRG